jgi:hypothetical protein
MQKGTQPSQICSGGHIHQTRPKVDADGELELIQTQVTQKPMLRAEGECACVAQMARAKIRKRGWPSPSQIARHLWVVRTLKMHRGRRLTCGTRSFIIVEAKNDLSTHKAPCDVPPGKGPDKARAPPSASWWQ